MTPGGELPAQTQVPPPSSSPPTPSPQEQHCRCLPALLPEASTEAVSDHL